MRSELNVDDSSSQRGGDYVQVLERTDEESACVILEVDGHSDG